MLPLSPASTLLKTEKTAPGSLKQITTSVLMIPIRLLTPFQYLGTVIHIRLV